MECPFGHLYDITYKAQLSSKSRHTEAVFHLNNRLNKRNLNTFNRIFISNTPVLALKISNRGMGLYFWTPCYGHGLYFKLPICLIGYTRHTYVIYERAKVIYFIYIQPRKAKYKHETGLLRGLGPFLGFKT